MKNIIKISLIAVVFIFTLDTFAQSHSMMEFNCSTCHSCDTPTKTDPCLNPCPREQMVTVYQSPEESPAIIKLDKLKDLEDIYEPVQFTHRLHAEMAGMSGGCAMCHHYNPPGNVVSCSECHSISRTRSDISKPDLKAAFHRQCIDCHQKWSEKVECASCHETNESGRSAFDASTQTGERVHPQIEEPTKLVYRTESYENTLVTFFHDEHIDLYGFECQDCHQNESCAACHDRREPVTDKDVAFTVSHQKCESCHTTTDDCESCHMTSELKPFNHVQRTGFALTPYHTKLRCATCHQTNEVFTGLSGSCNSCHENWAPDNFDHKVVGLELSESHVEWTCDVCHIDRNFTNTPTCDTCHDEDITYPDFEPGYRL
ncbi:MAG: cytochrome c3 family protein [Melioribacteraceae bacterium]|nr:cytochrome c3 family protein [Melioribacteraceae bacterium]